MHGLSRGAGRREGGAGPRTNQGRLRLRRRHNSQTIDVLNEELSDSELTSKACNVAAETGTLGRRWHVFTVRRSARAAMVFDPATA